MRNLPASIFATPGVCAYGTIHVLDENDEYAGLHLAEYVTMPWEEVLRPSMFVFVTARNRAAGGGQTVRRPFFVTELPYDPVHPDRPGVRGFWLTEGFEVLNYHDTKRMRKDVRIQIEKMERGNYVIDSTWREIVAASAVELSICVQLGTEHDTDDSDCDVLSLVGIFAIEQWKHVLKPITSNASIIDVHHGLGLPPPAMTSLFTNIIPRESSFEPIDHDVFAFAGRMLTIGAAPGRPTHAIEYLDTRDGKWHRVRPEGRPSGGQFLATRLMTASEVRASGAFVHNSLLVYGKRELVLTEDVIVVPLACMAKPVPILVVPPRAKATFGMAFESATHPLELMLVDNELVVIGEPSTEECVRADLMAVARFVGYESPTDTQRLLYNEARLQAVPEKQASLANALVVLRGFSLARALGIMRDPVWRGDRSLTLDQALTLEELREVLGAHPSDGWIIPEKEPDAGGVVRKCTKNKGYILVMMHDDSDGCGSNVISYCLETKRLTLRLALSYFGENLKFVKGACPPRKGEGEGPDHEFDIVTRAYQQRTTGEVWTEARALAHFRGQ